MPDFNKDIPHFPHSAYEVDISWQHLEQHLAEEIAQGLQLEPNFQRGHVWTEEQQMRFVEHVLRGGETHKQIIVNAPGWPLTKNNPDYVLIDGLQRLTAVRTFMRGELKAFGYVRSEWTGPLRYQYARFQWRVLTLPTRADILKYYLDINTAGTPHGEGEIRRVRKMLTEAKKEKK